MSKAKRAWPREYKAMCQESAANYETNDCAVISLALAYELSYKDSLGLLEDCGRSPRSGTRDQVIELAMDKMKRKYGINWRMIPSRELMVERKKLKLGKGLFWTFGNLISDGVWHNGVYLVVSRDHIACMINGRILDHAIDSKRIVIKLYEISRDCSGNCGIFD